jgi:hypothetical protein
MNIKSRLLFFYFFLLLPVFFYTGTAYAAAQGGGAPDDDGAFGGLGAPGGALARAIEEVVEPALGLAPDDLAPGAAPLLPPAAQGGGAPDDDGAFGGLGAPGGALARAIEGVEDGEVEPAPGEGLALDDLAATVPPPVAAVAAAAPPPPAAVAPPVRIPTSLHNGLTFQIDHGQPAAPVLHSPYNHHLTLTSYDLYATNEARVALAFFGTNGEIVHKPIDKLFIAGSSMRGMAMVGGRHIPIVSGRTLFPGGGDDGEYASFLQWLAAVNPTNNTLTRAAQGDPAEFFGNSGFSFWYHHTENWILWDIRQTLPALINELLTDQPGFPLNGLGIYLYTRNNPCTKCGPTIDNVPPHFAAQLDTISAGLGGAFGPVQVFSSVSSTYPYGNAYRPMAGLTDALAIATPSYQVAYAGLPGVMNNTTLLLNAAHGSSHHFWIPKLKHVTFSMDGDLLQAKLDSDLGVDAFLEGFSTHRHVAERVRILDFGGHDVEFTTARGAQRAINPQYFFNHPQLPQPFWQVTDLRLYNTNARSSHMPDMVRAFAGLAKLDLSGAIAEYRDSPPNAAEPRTQLWTALRELPLLEDLNLGSFHQPVGAAAVASNNITFREFAALLSVPPMPAGVAAAAPAVPFPSIKVLKLNDNQIFAAHADAQTNRAGEILTRFIQAPGRAIPPSRIDLSNNGPYMHVSAARAGIIFATAVPATNIMF